MSKWRATEVTHQWTVDGTILERIDDNYSILTIPDADKYLGLYPYKVYNNSIREFTGFLDENDKELYEGDLVEINLDATDKPEYGDIFWCSGSEEWCIGFRIESDDGKPSSSKICSLEETINSPGVHVELPSSDGAKLVRSLIKHMDEYEVILDCSFLYRVSNKSFSKDIAQEKAKREVLDTIKKNLPGCINVSVGVDRVIKK